MPKFQVTTPEGATHEFELTASRARFGRAEDNDIVIPDSSVSSYHGEYALTDEGVQLTDRGSTNGTHVNGQRVEQADIPWGGQFRLGNCNVILIGDGGEAQAEAAPAESYESEASSYEEESAAAAPAGFSGYGGPVGGSAVITGLGSTPCPSQLRRGFGPKVKEKDSGSGMLMMLAVLGMLACGAAAFMIFQMSA